MHIPIFLSQHRVCESPGLWVCVNKSVSAQKVHLIHRIFKKGFFNQVQKIFYSHLRLLFVFVFMYYFINASAYTYLCILAYIYFS